jgi:hypothetical protein
MILWLVRSIKRLLIFLTGVLVVYLAVWKFYPFFDHRIPVAFALLATYLFTAYVFIPAGIRLFRLIFRPIHIPLYCVTPDGFASDPINIGIIGTREQIISAMKQAGWAMPDKKNICSLFRVLDAMIHRRAYPNTPFSQLYLFGRKQDLGFALPIGERSSNRHHVRFWACHFEGPKEFHEHVRFWGRFHKPLSVDDRRQLWVGAASKDIGLIPIRHNAQITHMIDPNTDAERDIIVDTLRASHNVEHTSTVKVGAPYELRNRTVGGFLRSDGKMRICILKT